MPQSITFDGAARTVTGSCHIITNNGKTFLVDCGMFQGNAATRAMNWEPFPFNPREIDSVLITHAHMDHIGLLPKLVREGFTGPIISTQATLELARISLPDSGRLQEEDAYHHNKHNSGHGGEAHKPAMPLYTEKDAFACLKQFRAAPYDVLQELPGGGAWNYMPAGHILGSAFIEITFPDGERLLMSGDLGRYNTPIIKDPTEIEYAEYLVVESTYGDRIHPTVDPMAKIEEVLNDAWTNHRVILVPSFAIGRTQELLYYISKLQWAGKAPRVPIYVDSPMATSVTGVYAHSQEELDSEMVEALAHHENALEPEGLHFVRDSNSSKALNEAKGPMMIIAGSGMANGGRILHHLQHRLSDPKTYLLFTGYQGEGTLGRELIDGAPRVRIYGQDVTVRAEVDSIGSLSAHADQGEILRWLKCFKKAPKTTYIVHGEPPAQEALKAKIIAELGWDVVIPSRGDEFGLNS
jgi:metallo-beta-lactamase family protein